MGKFYHITVTVAFTVLLLVLGGIGSAGSTDNTVDSRSSQKELTVNNLWNMSVIWDNSSAHTDDIWMVRWSPNGTHLVSVGFDGQVIMWNGETSTKVWSNLGFEEYIRSVAWSPDGKRIAIGSDSGMIHIWNADTGGFIKVLNDTSLSDTKLAHNGMVIGLSWSQDGRTLASASGDDANKIQDGDNVVKLWNVTSGNKLFNLTKFNYYAMDVAFSPTAPELLGAAGDAELRIYDINTLALQRIFYTNGTVHCISWSPNGTLIGTGTRNFTVELFNVEQDSRAGYYYDSEFRRRELAWSPAGKFIAEGGSSDMIKIRSVEDGEIVKLLYGTPSRCSGNFLPSLSWSSTGRYLAAGSSEEHSVIVFGDKIYDRIPPKVMQNSPTGTSVSRSANIMVRFTEYVNYESFIAAFSYTDGQSKWRSVNGTVTQIGREFLFSSTEKLPENSVINVTINLNLTDLAGNRINNEHYWTFNTAANTAPVLSNSFMEPLHGDENTLFKFGVHYLDLDGDLPEEIFVVIDDNAYTLQLVNGTEHDGDYEYETTLTAGNHKYYFSAFDGMSNAVGSPAGSDHSQDFNVGGVDKEKDEDEENGLWALRADLIGGIIVILLILGWFKLVLRRSEEKKE